MTVSELNEDTQDQICDLLENLQQKAKLKIKIYEFCLIRYLENMEENSKNETLINPTISFAYFTKCCS